MSENEKNPPPGEPISEEQLDVVTGGGGTGCDIDPYCSKSCWFVPDGKPQKDGRTKCITQCLGNFETGEGKPVGKLEPGDWYRCVCWGTDNCVGKWHKTCGKPARTNWK